MLKACKRITILTLIYLVTGASSAQSVSDLDGFFRAVTDGRADLVKPVVKEHPEWLERELYMGIKPLYRAAVLGRSEVAQILLESGAKVDGATKRGNHPLHAAAQNGHLGMVLMLVAHKAPVDAVNEDSASALHLATQHKRVKVIKELLKNGANPNLLDKRKRSPLHYAAGLGRPDLVALLVEAGAELSPVDRKGYSPLGLARAAKRNSFGDVGGYLEARGAADIRPELETKKK